MYRLGEKVSLRDAYDEILLKLGAENERVVVLDADTSSISRTAQFAKAYPDRFFNVGLAEANMIDLAAGLAASGLIPFVTGMGAFLTLRGCENIRTSVAFPGLNVKLVGVYSGLSSGANGPTHFTIEDIGILQSIPGLTIVAPSDANAASGAVKAAAAWKGPVYLRLVRAELPIIWEDKEDFKIGKGIIWREGSDVAIVANGSMLSKSLEAAGVLSTNGVEAKVVEIHTIKPIDQEVIIEAARQTRCVVTVEEHNVFGGLGCAVSKVLSEKLPTLVYRVGIPDTFAESGTYGDLLQKYLLTATGVVEAVLNLLKQKESMLTSGSDQPHMVAKRCEDPENGLLRVRSH